MTPPDYKRERKKRGSKAKVAALLRLPVLSENHKISHED